MIDERLTNLYLIDIDGIFFEPRISGFIHSQDYAPCNYLI